MKNVVHTIKTLGERIKKENERNRTLNGTSKPTALKVQERLEKVRLFPMNKAAKHVPLKHTFRAR